MRMAKWRRLAFAVLSGAVLLQTPSCAEAALGITSLASLVTAGGVIYLVVRVID